MQASAYRRLAGGVATGAAVAVLAAITFTGVSARCKAEEEARAAARARAEEQEAIRKELAEDAPKLAPFARAFRNVARLVSPSVVHIKTSKEITLQGHPPIGGFPDDMFRRFFGLPDEEDGFGGRSTGPQGGRQRLIQTSEGSGVIVSAEGHVLTNNHVVAGAHKIFVEFADGRDLEATVIGTDPKTDIAVVKVEAEHLEPARWGSSAELAVGDWVIAIGNPFGLQHTVTAGIVSAIGRGNVGVADYEDFIQTDAAINPGNSGGPLVNLKGEVVGINTAIASRTGGYQGVGFAIPSDVARWVLAEIRKRGRVVRGWLGVAIQPMDSTLAARFGLDEARGALVSDVVPGGPAAEAGLRAGDVIVSLDQKRVDRVTDLRIRVAEVAPGSKLRVGYVRDGKPAEVVVTVGELPEDSQIAAAGERRGHGAPEPEQALGLTVRALTPSLARELGLPKGQAGVAVVSVEPDSPVAMAGLRPGDLIEEVNRVPTPDLRSFDKAMKAARLSEGILLRVRRGELSTYVIVRAG